MRRRALLQALPHLERVHTMAAVSTARGVWQRCLHELAGPLRSAASSAASARGGAVGKSTPRTPRPFSVGDSVHGVSEQSGFSWGRARPAADRTSCAVANGRVWYKGRQDSAAASGSSSLGHKFCPWEDFSQSCAMQFSTVSAREQNAWENVPKENLTSTETVVTETVVIAAEPSSELEFAPENESTPSAPLVQATQSEESVSVEDLSSSSSSPSEQLKDLLSDIESASARVPALPQTNSDRVVLPGRLYVGGLPFQMKGGELTYGLRELCGKYGIVTDVSLAPPRNQSLKSIVEGAHRGFAFVTMETPEQAQEVIDKLNGASMWGRVLMVSYGLKKVEPDPSERLTSTGDADVRCKVFVGNLHEGTSRNDLLSKFQQYGTVIDVKLITELHSDKSRGFGFVTFAEKAEAISAVLDCDGSMLDGSVIRVNIAKFPQGQ